MVYVYPDGNNQSVWDRIILVVNNPATQTRFDNWYDRFSVETNWLARLPAAYNRIGETTNRLGMVLLGDDPEPNTTNLWRGVGSPGDFMHHEARWEMRSERTVGGHGHQACYDKKGDIILTGVSAGTADYGGNPTAFSYQVHVEEDVKPFIRALQLDGNPCEQNVTELTHALIHDGGNMRKYRQCRPSLPNNKAMLAPGAVPQL